MNEDKLQLGNFNDPIFEYGIQKDQVKNTYRTTKKNIKSTDTAKFEEKANSVYIQRSW
jgi:hypothetical protein